MASTVQGRVMPIIAVPSVDDTRDFYVNTLGFQHVMGMVGKDGLLDFCTVTLGAASIMFNRGASPARPAGKQLVEIYLEVGDVDAFHNTLKKKGVAISDCHSPNCHPYVPPDDRPFADISIIHVGGAHF